ncbi:MAG: hypothetical protein AAF830_06205, partial [Pseudomonadota bacterium]
MAAVELPDGLTLPGVEVEAEELIAAVELPPNLEEAEVELVSFTDAERQAAVVNINEAIGARISQTYAGAETFDFSALNTAANFGDEELKAVIPVASQIRELDLGNTAVTDEG